MRIKQIVWNVAFRQSPTGTILNNDSSLSWKIIPNPLAKWAADPFIFEWEGETYIFAEIFDVLSWKGEIGYCKFKDNNFTSWKRALKIDTHLSFPYVFEHKGKIFMMPETGATQKISIYEAVRFPDEWNLIEDLYIGEKMADSIFIDEKTILSYRLRKNDVNTIIILKQDDKTKKYRIKQSIDDKLDIRRPAGMLLNIKGKIVRPVQDGRKRYGGGLNFVSLKFDESGSLSEEQIMSLELQSIKCNNLKYKIVGCHTYNSTSKMEVIDIQYERFNILDVIKRLTLKLFRKK